MESSRDEPYPERPLTGEVVQKGVEAAIASIPIVGSALAVGFVYAMTAPLDLRRAEWFNLLAERIGDLEDQFEELRSENLFNNEEFVSAAVMASQTAMAMHQEELREALANAVVNSALPGARDADTQKMLLRIIERFTVSHMRLLAYLDGPAAWFRRAGIPRPDRTADTKRELLLLALPELSNRDVFVDQLMRDLNAEGMLNADRGIYARYKDDELWASLTSDWGREFLRFISGHQPAVS